MTAPASSRSTAVVTVEPPGPTMVERAQVKELAPFVTVRARTLIEPLLRRRGATFDEVLSEIWMAIQKNPELKKCTDESLVISTVRILSWGLVIGEGAFLVKFSNKVKENNVERWVDQAQAICGYQGTAQRIVNAGGAKSIIAKCVYQNEIDTGRFDYYEGSVPRVDHRPILVKSQRGALVGAYARAIIDRNTAPLIHWMDLEEIDAIRQKYSKSWKTEWVDGKQVPIPLERLEWYVKKTPILQLGKFLSKNEKSAAVIAELEREQAEIFEGAVELADVEALETAPSVAQPAAATPPAAPASAADVAWAKALPFPLKKGEAVHGKPMGGFSSEHLVSIGEWIVAKQQTKGLEFQNDMLRAIHLILTDRDTNPTPPPAPIAALVDEEDDLPF